MDSKITSTPKAEPQQQAVAPEVEATSSETGFAENLPGLGHNLKSPLQPQQTASLLQRIPNQKARQRAMQTIQRTYGNGYAGKVVSNYGQINRITATGSKGIIQRHPADANLLPEQQEVVDEIQTGEAAQSSSQDSSSGQISNDNSTQATAASQTSNDNATADQATNDNATSSDQSQDSSSDQSSAATSTDIPLSSQTNPSPTSPPATHQAMSLSQAQTVLQATYGRVHTIVPGNIVILANRAAIQVQYDTVNLGRLNTYAHPPRPWQTGDAVTYLPTLEGFADNGTVYVNQQTPLMTATAHEMLHLNTGPGFRSRMGEQFNEGSTENFAIEALTAQNVAFSETAYPSEVDLVKTLIQLVGEDMLLNAYFNGGSAIDDLIKKVEISQGVGTFTAVKDYAADGNFASAKAALRPGGGTQQEPQPINDNSEVAV